MHAPHLPVDFDLDEDLLPQHLEEWTRYSGVSEAITRLNVTSYAGESVHELLIGDRLEEAGAHGQQYATGPVRVLLDNRDSLELGGWWCQGVDLQNGCNSATEFGVFKPDHPRVKKNGKPAKYEHPHGIPERIVALRMPDPDFWARIKADPSIDIVLDESGGKKAGAWLTAGIPALGVPGIWAGTPPIDSDDPEPTTGFGYGDSKPGGGFVYVPKDRQLHPDLEVLAPGRRFIVSFDFEESLDGQQRRDAATRLLVDQLFKAGAANVAVAHREGPEKGADDLLVAQGEEALHDLLASAEDASRGQSAPSWERQPTERLTGTAHPAELLANAIAERIYAGRQWAHENDRAITDTAPLIQLTNTPGTGKSHLVPQTGPRLLEIKDIDRVIYISDTYRSPSIGELHRWIAPPTRHSGLVVEQVEGLQRLRRRKRSDSEEMVVEKANCGYSGGLQQFRDQGTSQESITHFCSKVCPIRMGCSYLQERSEFLKGLKSGDHRLLRCSVESIPALQYWLGKKAWAKTFLIFDEAPQIEKSAIRIRQLKLDRFPIWATWLRIEYPDHMASPAGQQLIALLDALTTIESKLEPQQKQFGLQPQELLRALPPIPSADDLHFLEIPEPELTAMAPDADHQEQTLAVPRLLPSLLRALRPTEEHKLPSVAFYSPQDGGSITVVATALPLTVAALSSAGSLVLDGTAALDDINRALRGGAPAPADHLAPMAITTPTTLKPANLEITQIADLGPMGRNRGADKQRRLEALLPALQQHTIDRFGPMAKLGVLEKSHFRSRESGHGIWFVDNQGSNAYENDQALAMVGTPAPNLTASLSQFQVAHNQPTATLNSNSFRDWYGRRMGEQIIQGIHRLRPIRRNGETLQIFLITDIDLSNVIKPGGVVSFTKTSSGAFTKAAAPKKDRTRDKVVEAIQELNKQGINPSQRAVAQKAGISKTQVLRQAGDGSWGTFVQLCIERG